jgi:transcriptional regulator with XRE-family HTH domain
MEAEKNLQIALGKKLRRLREARGLSQQKLARLARMVQPMINRFETGERKMSSDHAMKLAPPLNIVPTELLPPGINAPVRQAATDTQFADAHPRIRELIQQIDRHDELIAELQRQIQELKQACQDALRQGTVPTATA